MRKNPLLVLLMSILTFGAYGVYWYWQVNETLRMRGEEVRPAVSALAVSWGAFLVVPALVSCWRTADRLRDQRGGGRPRPGLAVLLLLVLAYMPYIQWHLNRLPENAPAS